jgi:hypothetical protein
MKPEITRRALNITGPCEACHDDETLVEVVDQDDDDRGLILCYPCANVYEEWLLSPITAGYSDDGPACI